MECAPVPQARLAERADPCPTGINEFQTAISSASQAGMGAKTCFISPELISNGDFHSWASRPGSKDMFDFARINFKRRFPELAKPVWEQRHVFFRQN